MVRRGDLGLRGAIAVAGTYWLLSSGFLAQVGRHANRLASRPSSLSQSWGLLKESVFDEPFRHRGQQMRNSIRQFTSNLILLEHKV